MPGIARVGDTDSEGDTILETVQVTVFVDNMPIAVVGDMDTNDDTFNSGSPTVFANGQPVLRLGDVDNNSDSIVSASTDVFADG